MKKNIAIYVVFVLLLAGGLNIIKAVDAPPLRIICNLNTEKFGGDLYDKKPHEYNLDNKLALVFTKYKQKKTLQITLAEVENEKGETIHISNNQIHKLLVEGDIKIEINKDGVIKHLQNKKIRFPFMITVIYDNKPFSSKIIGSKNPDASYENHNQGRARSESSRAVDKIKIQKPKKQMTPFYDTLILVDAFDKEQLDVRIVQVLSKYLPVTPKGAIEKKKKLKDKIVYLTKQYKDNKFLIDFLNKSKNKEEISGTQVGADLESVPETAFNGLSVTKLAGGAAAFLVERTKEELSVAFFKKFKNEINKTEKGYLILHVLFPQTKGVLNTIDKEIYKFSSFIQVLREAFEKDLSNVYTNIRKLLDEEEFKELFQDSDRASVLIEFAKLAFDITDGFSTEKNPGDILENLNLNPFEAAVKGKNSDKNKKKLQNLCSSLKLLQAFSKSLKRIPDEADRDDTKKDDTKKEDRYWVDAKSLKKLIDAENNYRTFNIYLGLLYQQTKNIEFHFSNSSEKFGEILLQLKENKKIQGFKELGRFFKRFGSKIDFINTRLVELSSKKDKGKDLDYNDYYKIYNAALDLVDYTNDICGIIKTQILTGQTTVQKVESKLDFKIKKYLNVARTLGNIYLDINHRNYSSAVFNTIHICDNVLMNHELEDLKEERESKKTELKKIKEELKGKEKELKSKEEELEKVKKKLESIVKLLKTDIIKLDNKISREEKNETKIKNKERYEKIKAKLLKFGAFMAAVAKAENSDQVKEAIKSVALPSGSYSVKRDSSSNISLNAYVGLTASDEHFEKDIKRIDGLYVWAPIGVAFSKGGYEKVFGSASLFISVIDLGAVAAYRFGNEKDENIPDFTLRNIVAPGVHFVLGFKNSPISIGTGYQFGPQLRKIGVEGAAIDAGAWRWNILFVAVDIPLLNFRTKTKY